MANQDSSQHDENHLIAERRAKLAARLERAAAAAYAPEHGLRAPYADGFKLGKATIQRNGKTGEVEVDVRRWSASGRACWGGAWEWMLRVLDSWEAEALAPVAELVPQAA